MTNTYIFQFGGLSGPLLEEERELGPLHGSRARLCKIECVPANLCACLSNFEALRSAATANACGLLLMIGSLLCGTLDPLTNPTSQKHTVNQEADVF